MTLVSTVASTVVSAVVPTVARSPSWFSPRRGLASAVIRSAQRFGTRSISDPTMVRHSGSVSSAVRCPHWFTSKCFGLPSGSLPEVILWGIHNVPEPNLCPRSRQQDVTQFCDAKLTRWALIHKAHRSPNATACVKKFWFKLWISKRLIWTSEAYARKSIGYEVFGSKLLGIKFSIRSYWSEALAFKLLLQSIWNCKVFGRKDFDPKRFLQSTRSEALKSSMLSGKPPERKAANELLGLLVSKLKLSM